MKRSPMPSKIFRRAPVEFPEDSAPVRMPGKVDRAYLDWVATHDCCVHFLGGCMGRVVAHHYPQGAGFKDDARTVAMCGRHHGYWHANQTLTGMDHDQCVALFNAEQLKLLTEWRDAG